MGRAGALEAISLRFRTGTALVLATAAGADSAFAQDAAATAAATTLPTLTVDAAPNSDAIGYRNQTPSVPRLTEPLRDTPQSITTINRQLLDDQNATTLRDALRNTPGISISAGEFGSQGDNLTIRGFNARNDIYLDSMNDFGSYYRDSFNYERVDVLFGPSSILFGKGSTGGVVNQVSKVPTLEPITAGTISFGTDGTKRITADVDRAIAGVKGGAFRINVMGTQQGIAGRDDAEYNRYGFAPSLSLGIGSPTRIDLNFFHQTEYDKPDYGLPWLDRGARGGVARPAPVDRDNFYGFNNDYLRTNADIGTARVTHEFGNGLTLREQLRYASYTRDFRITEPQLTALFPYSTPLSSIAVNRNELSAYSQETFFGSQTDLTGRFQTGFIQHDFVGGLEFSRTTSSPNRRAFTGAPTTNLLNPVDQAFNGPFTISTRTSATNTINSLYVGDTLKLTEQFQFLASARIDQVDSHASQSVTPATYFRRKDAEPSWRVGAVYKPVRNASTYFMYGTSFNPSGEAVSLTSASSLLPPEENETFELGGKIDLLDEQLSLTGALFRITKNNARETDPNNSLFQILAGVQQVDGISIQAQGQITPKWLVNAGYAFLQGSVISSPQGDLGNRLVNTPKHTATLFTTYALPWNITVGGGVNYVGSRNASSTRDANGFIKTLPSYTVVNLLAKYKINDQLEAQVNLYNVGDLYYYDQVHPSHVIPGAGQSALFSLSFKS